FERLCVLYNIAALMSQIGSEANLQTDDGLKTAAKYFQESAGIFSYIKEKVLSVVGNNQSTTDLTVEVLNAYSCVMLGQAQECFYDKAISVTVNKKPEVLAKVAMQTSHLYSEAAKALVEADSSYSLGAVQSLCSAKKELFQCYAQHQQAKAANADKRFGEAIARYRVMFFFPAHVLNCSLTKDHTSRCKQFLGAAEKDNNFIYNDIIPKASSVPVIGKAPIAKAKAFNKNENLSMKFTDLFSSLVPLAVHNAVEAYSARRKELVDREIERIRELNNLINGVMSSFNLPAALEDMSGSDLPQSIIDKSRVVIDKGGVVPIDQLLQILPESLDRNQQILTEAKLFICFSTEHSSDAELREKFGEKWRRKPSAELTLPLRQEMSKYQTIIENAQKADGIIRAKYTDNKVGIELLCLPVEKLKNAVPSSSPLAALKGHPVSLVVQELKQLCEQVGTIKAEREVMETELRTTTYDMTDKFTRILAEEGCLNEDSISPKELNRIYQPLIEQVNDSGDRQESLLANLQVVGSGIHVGVFYNSSFDYHLVGEEVLKTIAAAFDKYMELTAHLQEGNKFYGDLTELLLKLQPKCSDFVFARKTEKEELLKCWSTKRSTQCACVPPTTGCICRSQEAPCSNIPSQTPPTSVPPPTVTVASQNVPSAPQYTQRQDPYGYPTGAPHPGYTPYPVPGYGPPPGPAPYPQHLPYAYPSQPGYAPQGYPAYPPQPPQPGY
uniref:BRO1 domain-containing protein n=1 Tax=Ciona savignyi TaxID=51511 RepID=H2YHX3_CIOSA